ncbi:unnamed protein product [Alternaria burnsii]|nr:unnamed protein product [Alternaria burnsii]
MLTVPVDTTWLTKDLLDYYTYSELRDVAKILNRSVSIIQNPQRLAVLRFLVQGLKAYYRSYRSYLLGEVLPISK